jgi:hypothetical protein
MWISVKVEEPWNQLRAARENHFGNLAGVQERNQRKSEYDAS